MTFTKEDVRNHILQKLKEKGILHKGGVTSPEIKNEEDLIVTEDDVIVVKKYLYKKSIYEARGQAETCKEKIGKKYIKIMGCTPKSRPARQKAEDLKQEFDSNTLKVIFIDEDPDWNFHPIAFNKHSYQNTLKINDLKLFFWKRFFWVFIGLPVLAGIIYFTSSQNPPKPQLQNQRVPHLEEGSNTRTQRVKNQENLEPISASPSLPLSASTNLSQPVDTSLKNLADGKKYGFEKLLWCGLTADRDPPTNIRSETSKNSKKLGEVPNGTLLKVYEERVGERQQKWLRVIYREDGSWGWVAKRLVQETPCP